LTTELNGYKESVANTYATKEDLKGQKERIDTIETFFKAAVEPESTIDNLNEILKYIEDHKGEAIDMAADIQTNANDIGAL
jgi:hypothetical protein